MLERILAWLTELGVLIEGAPRPRPKELRKPGSRYSRTWVD